MSETEQQRDLVSLYIDMVIDNEDVIYLLCNSNFTNAILTKQMHAYEFIYTVIHNYLLRIPELSFSIYT